MSWFNASHLSSFAKQALSSAQKSIDRVLDIKEDDQWGDTTVMPYDDVNLPAKLSLSGGWGMTQWEAPTEEKTTAPPPPSEAITTPVTRTVVDESENFFNTFLSPGDIQPAPQTQVVSVPPAKSQRRPQEDKKKKEDEDQNKETECQEFLSSDLSQAKESVGESNNQPQGSVAAPNDILLEPIQADLSATGEPLSNSHNTMGNNEENAGSTDSVDSKTELSRVPPVPHVEENTTESTESACVPSETKSTLAADPALPSASKEGLTEHKDSKPEDRQNDTPSPPVSAFSSGTSTTSDIEVLDHESVLSESSASSRQETGESKAGLHLMQGSFQLLTASTCADFPRLEDYSKLTESCGSSSDAFERIDSFSVQSLDSRSVSEVNSDDEIPSSRTLASVTAGSVLLTDSSVVCTKPEALEEKEGEEEEGEGEPLMETIREQQSVDEMEESGRSATPVNSDQPEEWAEQESEASSRLVEQSSKPEKVVIPPITQDMKSFSTVQILELQKVNDELSSRLEQRETQLLTVSKDKAKLEEECDNLKDEILSLKAESSTVQSLKEEFTQRIADTERKAQLACKERDIAKKVLGIITGLSMYLVARGACSNDLSHLLFPLRNKRTAQSSKGEKLSKQQLQHSNIIKKLRVKEKESDNRITKQQKKIKDLEEELSQLQQVLDGKEEVERQHRENIKKLNSVVERQEKELSRLQTDAEELQENNRSLQAALDTSYKELAELHKTNASRASEAEEAALSRDAQAKEKLSLALEKAQEEARIQQEALADQVTDLRLALQRAEQQQARKEDYLGWRSLNCSSGFRRPRPGTRNSARASHRQHVLCCDRSRTYRHHWAARQRPGKSWRKTSRIDWLLLNNQLEMEKMKVEQEKKKCFLAQEALKEKERKSVTLSIVEPPATSTPTLSRSSSISGADTAGLHSSVLSQDDSLDHSLTATSLSMSIGGTNVYEAARFSGGSSIMENLQSQLKLREGEIAQLQIEISNLERTRAVMAEELVRLTNQNDDIEEKVKEIPKLRIQLKDLEQRHNTILQMYGEKAEEAEELRLDLEDVKNMYKTQIDELLRN
ncbi:unnamed protein product, partial [Tetraodon nigroviridis]